MTVEGGSVAVAAGSAEAAAAAREPAAEWEEAAATEGELRDGEKPTPCELRVVGGTPA